MAIFLITIIVASLILGLIKYKSISDQYVGKKWQSKFSEMWNDFFNYFISGLIGYYFIFIRLPFLNGDSMNAIDIVLFFIFILGIFGHLCVISKNLADGIQAILDKILKGR
ncbi:MAG TPA: hypothetical protein P5080_02250 [Candidatus Paceibacterota bacterium]|nr:hypothetical protein [Candidatus Pacearchaeota archaeon]HRZ50791.1 hypothetical protein [Candidatus Paceibacterota bacterium]HSA36512.1 hypothetical protein [Candidatus Paceibacterota bacterium]